MREESAVHELDALDLASLWPFGGHASLAPLDAFADCHVASKGAELLRATTATRSRSGRHREEAWLIFETREGGNWMGDDAIYFARRAAQELTAATEAEHPKAREAHLRMARHYQDLVNAGALR